LAPFVLIQIYEALRALDTVVTALATVAIAWFTWTLWRSSEKSWLAAGRSADIAERALIASRRAWLSIGELKIIHPTKITEEGATIRVQFTVKNLGETPASHVWPEAIHWLDKGPTTYAAAFEQFQTRLKNHIVAKIPGPLLFPKEGHVMRLVWMVDADSIGRATVTGANNAKRVSFALFLAVAYKIDGDESPHLTFIPYDWLNVLIGLEVPDGQSIEMLPAPFGKGVAT